MARGPQPQAPRDPIAVISAYGAFRVLMVLLAIWTFFAGFSLLTQGVGALSFGGGDGATERVVGGHMIMLVPIYALLAWRRDQYRLLIWMPYAAQLAIILPTFFDLVLSRDRDFGDAALILIVSIIFFVLLVYFWWSSHPADFFAIGEPEEAAIDDEHAVSDAYNDEPGASDDGPTRRPPPHSIS